MRHPLSTVLIFLAFSSPAQAASDLRIVERSPQIEIDVTIDERAHQVPGLGDALRAEADALVAEYRGAAREDFAERGSEQFWSPHSLEARYEITFIGDSMVSVLATIDSFTGGAHGNQYFTTSNFDPGQELYVTPEDLFGAFDLDSDAFLSLQAYARESLAAERANRLELSEIPPEDFEWILEGTSQPEQLSTFTLLPSSASHRASGIRMYFPPYQVGSYVEGSYTLDVPALVFIDYLAPEFFDLFDASL